MSRYEGQSAKDNTRQSLRIAVLVSYFALCTSYLPAADPGSVEDVQDVLFLHESRPILLRLHILMDGKPYTVRWTEYMTRWFRFLDRNEDGFLDRKEAARAPADRVLEQLLLNPSAFSVYSSPAFEDFDRNRDRKVSLEEFLRYYSGSRAGPVQSAPPFNQPVRNARPEALTDALYTLLDKNRDGKLSKAELAQAESVLRKYDQDDDEVLSMQELQAAVAPPRMMAPPASPQAPAMQAPPFPLILVPREDGRRLEARLTVARKVLTHYDRNENKGLSREEIGLAKELFDRLDANKDGELDAFELMRWIILRPDAEAVVRLGRIEDKKDAITPMGEKNPALQKKAGSRLTYATREQCLNLIVAPSVTPQNPQQVRQILMQQFKTADQKQKGFVTKKQVQQPQFYNLHSILTVADRDGDECLDLDELNAWLDLTTSGINCRISVTLTASGRGLFQILDTDQDGRLGIRELRNAWKQLTAYDHDHDEAIAVKEIPLQYQVVINPGTPNYVAGQFNVASGQRGAVPVAPTRGPLWFRKMDRNGDGDVSRREFLGRSEDFHRLDSDGDGFISLEEALQADAKLRKK